jgi:hypothetical protein
MRRPEQALQKQVARYLDFALPKTATWFHPANGGYRRKAEARIFKGLGVKAGVPDIVIIWEGRAYFIELKAGTNKLTEHQVNMMRSLTDAGAGWHCCTSLESVTETLDGWGIPLKARAA